jgi:hypothetical protein
LGLNRIWPVAHRTSHNELIGWQLGILGTLYAVIMGFMFRSRIDAEPEP